MLISFDHAKKILREAMTDYGSEELSLINCAGRVLRSELIVDRDFPAFDRVMMDGYALRAAELSQQRLFRVRSQALAGQARGMLDERAYSCVEVMTGAPMPTHADAVVPFEATKKVIDGWISIDEGYEAKVGQFIHRAGIDARQGDVALTRGCLIGSREMGVAASCGATTLTVARVPRIIIQPTGDELVPVDQLPGPSQIRHSNGYALAAALQAMHCSAEIMPIMSDQESLTELKNRMMGAELILITGAASKGRHDFVPSYLNAMGARCLFHGVAQRPGKPMGAWQTCEGKIVIALPGNPVSAMMGFYAIVMPALQATFGQKIGLPRMVQLDSTPEYSQDFTRHLPVRWERDGVVKIIHLHNSGDFMGLLGSDGWITLHSGNISHQQYEFHEWS